MQLEIGYISQNVTADTMQCHYSDGWGPSKNDPEGIEGLQDCLLGRYGVCAKTLGGAWSWFDFTACTYRNQKETDTLTDKAKALNATVKYCADVSGIIFDSLSECAHGTQGYQLFLQSHIDSSA